MANFRTAIKCMAGMHICEMITGVDGERDSEGERPGGISIFEYIIE